MQMLEYNDFFVTSTSYNKAFYMKAIMITTDMQMMAHTNMNNWKYI